MPYIPVHAPVYGYLKGGSHTIPLHQVFFAGTYGIMRIVNRLPFSSLLNVGGAEGFHNHLCATLFNTAGVLPDMAPQALNFAERFFHIPAVRGDGNHLPFRDKSFDLVTCIEAIEHIPQPQRLIAELKRVARHFVLVSTESFFGR